MTGQYWLQTVPQTHALVALDIADPEHPREVSNVTFCDDEEPHCAASQITIQGARYPEAMERMSNR